MNRNYRVALLTILVMSVFIIALVMLFGVSPKTIFRDDIKKGEGEGVFYSNEGTVYHGELLPEQIKRRDEIVDKMAKTSIQFYETDYNFGAVSRGETVKHTYHFKNTGSYPLMVSKADVFCGCTVTDFSQDPIPPGVDGDLTIEFNTTGKSGYQHNTTIVHTNTVPGQDTLVVEADIN